MKEDRICSKESWDKKRVIEFLEQFDGVEYRGNDRDSEVFVEWNHMNQVDEFKILAEHGWMVTSTTKYNQVWFEKIE